MPDIFPLSPAERNPDVLNRAIRSGLSQLLGVQSTADGALQAANNLSDLASPATARTNLKVNESLLANRTYYFRSDGNDSNDGLTNTAGGAKLTFAGAVSAASLVNPNGFTITFKAGEASHTWTVPFLVSEGVFLYGANYVIEGDTSTPTNHVVSIASASNACIDIRRNPGIWTVKGFKTTSSNSGTNGLFAKGAKVYYQDMNFGTLTGAGSAHIAGLNAAHLEASGNWTVSGNAGYLGYLDDFTFHSTGTSNTATMSGSPAWTTAGFYCHASSILHATQTTFSGAATGKRFIIDYGGTIDAASLTALPGDVAGDLTGGWYNGVFYAQPHGGRTTQYLTSGSGATYTTPANCMMLIIKMIGGGGGGGAQATNDGSTGGTTTFNSINAAGGSGGTNGGTGSGGAGGTGGTGSANLRLSGSGGHGSVEGGLGGSGLFGMGSPTYTNGAANGAAGGTNTGAGGGGGHSAVVFAGGGGSGEYVELIISGPAASYTYTVGAGGNGGAAGTQSGGNGGSGLIIVEEYYS